MINLGTQMTDIERLAKSVRNLSKKLNDSENLNRQLTMRCDELYAENLDLQSRLTFYRDFAEKYDVLMNKDST